MDLIQLSQKALQAAKLGKAEDSFNDKLAKIDSIQLDKSLINDDLKKAFWLNIYNTYIVRKLINEGKTKGFYTTKFIKFKDILLSFDDIEHGILRRNKMKLSFGYLDKLKTKDWQRLLQVDELDYRIHFALNCGANSCPPITSYNAENINQQLCDNTKSYLKDASVFSIDKSNRIKVPRLFLWYFADFGGFKGIKKLYRKYNLLPSDTEPKFTFLSYDWTVNIDNYTTDIK